MKKYSVSIERIPNIVRETRVTVLVPDSATDDEVRKAAKEAALRRSGASWDERLVADAPQLEDDGKENCDEAIRFGRTLFGELCETDNDDGDEEMTDAQWDGLCKSFQQVWSNDETPIVAPSHPKFTVKQSTLAVGDVVFVLDEADEVLGVYMASCVDWDLLGLDYVKSDGEHIRRFRIRFEESGNKRVFDYQDETFVSFMKDYVRRENEIPGLDPKLIILEGDEANSWHKEAIGSDKKAKVK